MTPDQEHAAWITGVLWQALFYAGGTRIREHHHYPAAFDAAWLGSLSIPDWGDPPPGQPVTLIDGENMDRFPGVPDCPRGARTLVLEDIGACNVEAAGELPWYVLTGRHLTLLSGGPRVTCTFFESRWGDRSFVSHRDAWVGGIVQLSGTKRWLIGESLLDGSGVPAKSVITNPGDILLIPKEVAHSATTPEDPGHSEHLAFAFDRDPAGGAAAGTG